MTNGLEKSIYQKPILVPRGVEPRVSAYKTDAQKPSSTRTINFSSIMEYSTEGDESNSLSLICGNSMSLSLQPFFANLSELPFLNFASKPLQIFLPLGFGPSLSRLKFLCATTTLRKNKLKVGVERLELSILSASELKSDVYSNSTIPRQFYFFIFLYFRY